MENQNIWDVGRYYQPHYSELAVECQACGRMLTGGEGYYQRDGKPYCEECVESADLAELIRICETDTDELYRSMGLCHAYVGGEED